MTTMHETVPRLVMHSDWGSEPKKRWMTAATFDGAVYRVDAPEPVGDVKTFIQRVIKRARGGQVVIGFDFPFGLPEAYAQRAKIQSFRQCLQEFGQGSWARFYDIAESAAEISLNRPFYPLRTGGKKQVHLLNGLGLANMTDLFRRCERSRSDRRLACSLFWTLGANQVGRAAIIGWRDVLSPALRTTELGVSLWPFDGDLPALLKNRSCIVVETYPAEACVQLGLTSPGRGWSKRNQKDRSKHHRTLSTWVDSRLVYLSPALDAALQDGFGVSKDGDDPFDATVGLFSMLEVVLGNRAEGSPQDLATKTIEGWILGQVSTSSNEAAQHGITPEKSHSHTLGCPQVNARV